MNKHLFKKIYKILLKKHESVYLNQDHSFSHSAFPVQQGKDATIDWSSQMYRAPLPTASGWRAFVQGKEDASLFHPASSYLPEAKFQVSVVIGGVSAFFFPALLVKWNLYFGSVPQQTLGP